MNKGFIFEIKLLKEDENELVFVLPKGISMLDNEKSVYITFVNEGEES